MLLAGKNITTKEEGLKKISIDYFYHSIKHPKGELETQIRNLRIMRQLDMKQYQRNKSLLPYVVSGVFNPPYRRKEHFAYIRYFFLDIDHLSMKGKSLLSVKTKIDQDPRTMLSFASPSNDGLKVLFKLKERCYDATIYSLFYKVFVEAFSKQYGLDQLVDKQTCDVTRCCFISYDETAFYRPTAELVDLSQFVELDNPSFLFDLKKKTEQEWKESKQPTVKNVSKEPSKDVMATIRQHLLPKTKQRQTKAPAFVPKEVDAIMVKLTDYIATTGAILYEKTGIQYGRKLKFKAENRLAELNLFYGKKGFSVVISPKRGTNGELNQLMAELVEQFLIEQNCY